MYFLTKNYGTYQRETMLYFVSMMHFAVEFHWKKRRRDTVTAIETPENMPSGN
jgi:hypothetical protein